MATWASLTSDQQAAVQAWLTPLRGQSGNIASTFTRQQALMDSYDATVGAIVSSLDPSEILPNTSGLSGAGEIAAGSVLALVTGIKAVLATYNTSQYRQVYVVMAGPTNCTG